MEQFETRESSEGTVVDAAGSDATDAFAVLGNETRLRTLLALWEAHEPFAEAEDDALPFSTLRERVGTADSGRFNYHLDRLLGGFVERTDEGYVLRGAGHEIVRTVVAGVGIDDPALGDIDVDLPCPRCDAPLVVRYEDRKLSTRCPDCAERADDDDPEWATVMETEFDPVGVIGRSASEAILANGVQERQRNAMRLAGVCPGCSGVVDAWFEVCDGHDTDPEGACARCGRHDRIEFRFACTVCKDEMRGPASVAAVSHPAGQSFRLERGPSLEFGSGDADTLERLVAFDESFASETRLRSEDPLRVEVTLRHGGDRVRFVFDESVSVVDIDRPA
jgi:hypothetical protein